jgi:hypothetical protein
MYLCGTVPREVGMVVKVGDRVKLKSYNDGEVLEPELVGKILAVDAETDMVTVFIDELQHDHDDGIREVTHVEILEVL